MSKILPNSYFLYIASSIGNILKFCILKSSNCWECKWWEVLGCWPVKLLVKHGPKNQLNVGICEV